MLYREDLNAIARLMLPLNVILISASSDETFGLDLSVSDVDSIFASTCCVLVIITSILTVTRINSLLLFHDADMRCAVSENRVIPSACA